MAEPARRRATLDDLRDLSDHLVGEIPNGDLVTSPRPAPSHAQAASSLSGELYAPFHRGRGDPGGWIILNEPELHLQGGCARSRYRRLASPRHCGPESHALAKRTGPEAGSAVSWQSRG